MIIYSGILFLILSAIIAFFSNVYFGAAKREMTHGQHRWICILAVIAGIAVRFYALDSLLPGVNAEEALSAVQAKSLWQTGGFLFHGKLTAQFQQWVGESNGPLYSLLAAPFVGVMGMSALAVRLPMALLSCLSMFAAYGIGRELSGEKAGRWMLIIYALCPAFVLNARFAASANAAVFLAPIAFYLMLRGFRSEGYLFTGMCVTGLLAYTYDMYFFIVPFVIAAAAVAAKTAGVKLIHVTGAVILGVLVYIPACLTLWVNLSGSDGFVLLGVVNIPRLDEFVKAEFIWTGCENLAQVIDALSAQLYSVFLGVFLQLMRHANISNSMFAPAGVLAFYTMSIPIALLGVLSIVCCCVDRDIGKNEVLVKRVFIGLSGFAVLIVSLVVGNRGVEDINGGTNVYDYSTLFMFFSLVMTAGLCRIERKSVVARGSALGLFAASFAMLCVFIFGEAYVNEANTHFVGMDEACRRAEQRQEETGYKVYITSSVYPHINPGAAAEMMYLYSVDADMDEAAQNRGSMYETMYMAGAEQLMPEAIYVVNVGDIGQCDLEGWEYEEFGLGEFAVLSPVK